VTGGERLRELLRGEGVHLFDGAMGTVLYERGIFVNLCYDELNLTQPALIEEVHRAYVEAGAEILETNTFGANPVKLSGFGLEARTEEINRAAVACARRAIGTEGAACVVGAIGPLGIRIEPWGPTSEEEAREYFARQARGLLEGGVDGFLLETFQDPAELHQALLAVRELSDLPIIAQVTIEEGGRTAYGTDVETVAGLLEGWGADAIGLNCSVGPVEMLEAIERMREVTTLPLSAQPNAGLPRTVGDRKMYLAGPEYMARYARRLVEAGARLVGGCCGTTPEHIRRMAEALAEGPQGERAPGGPPRTLRTTSPRPLQEPVPLEQRSTLGHRLAEGGFIASLELVPPRGWDPGELLESARRARIAGVDLVTLPDAPRGLPRMASIPAALLVARETGLEVLPHYACRDRNMLGMISDLMGAAAAGIRNLLIVTGDLSPAGPYPDHTAVFDIDSIGLTNVLHHLNRGVDPGGHPVEPPTSFVIGVAVNPGAVDLERELSRYRWKSEAGAEFVLTQPVFDSRLLLDFLERREGPPLPVLAGLWPLDSVRSAEFLDNEVPGVRVPPTVLERMREAESRGPEEARAEGVRIALETAGELLGHVQGIHVSSSRGRLDSALEVLRGVRRAGGT
jgi:methionine synthase / methylenetetrahydrofolate reductase(NADPH)